MNSGFAILPNFQFHTGEVLPELRIHYETLGQPGNPAVLVLHGTAGSAQSMLTPAFGGELFGSGQPLDAERYFIIIPDAIGAGQSSRPSEGLRARFPRYNYDDMVAAQYRLVTEHFGLSRLRMVLGNSMGGMHTWIWAQRYPDMMDIAVPMASMPTEMSGRNWMTRRLIIDSIRNDPDWQGGDYMTQPLGVQRAVVFFGIATNGGNQGLQKLAPTRERADALLDERLNAPFAADANDLLYQWDASRDYDASHELEKITATVLAINSADDERNPPELGVFDRELKRIKHARLLLIAASADTCGHATTGQAVFWKHEVERVLRDTPSR
jgi:homoserine O-acetyltransferase